MAPRDKNTTPRLTGQNFGLYVTIAVDGKLYFFDWYSFGETSIIFVHRCTASTSFFFNL